MLLRYSLSSNPNRRSSSISSAISSRERAARSCTALHCIALRVRTGVREAESDEPSAAAAAALRAARAARGARARVRAGGAQVYDRLRAEAARLVCTLLRASALLHPPALVHCV